MYRGARTYRWIGRVLTVVSLAALLLPPTFASAGERGNSGLPDGPGNPLADLQRQIDTLSGRVGALEGAQPLTVPVDCAAGTVGAVLASAPDVPLTIVVRGTCAEHIIIARDDIALVADPAGGAIVGPDAARNTVSVTGSRVTIDGLAISGGRVGVAAQGAGRLTVRNCTVENTGRNGISLFHGSEGTITDCAVQNNARNGINVEGAAAIITNNTISGNASNGVVVYNNGSARVGITNQNTFAGNTISGNGNNGVSVHLGSSALLGANLIDANRGFGVMVSHAAAYLVGQNTIQNHAGAGILVRGTAWIGQPDLGLPSQNLIANNGDGGVTVVQGTAHIRDATITGNVSSQNAAVYVRQGNVEIVNSTISQNPTHGLLANVGSSVDLQNTTISGNGGNGLWLLLTSSARLTGGAIDGNAGHGIQMGRGSGLQFRSPGASVQGNQGFGLKCFGVQNGYDGDVSGIFGNAGGQVDCTPF